jgi:hypothetical protein
MNIRHEKSPCCKGRIIRFGKRRKQCNVCRKTWRLWQRKRGRRKQRARTDILAQYFNGHFVSIKKEALRRKTHESTLRRRLKRSANQFTANNLWEELPDHKNKYVLLADAMVKYINHRWWTIYLTAVKSPDRNDAVLLPPVIQQGKETYYGWVNTLNVIPLRVRKNVAVLVCDGHRGLVIYARWSKWLVQRCHAHLLLAISGRRSHTPWGRHQKEGKQLHDLAVTILTTSHHEVLKQAIADIEMMGWETKSRQLQHIISGFVNTLEDYRTYLIHPVLHIPHTNNAMESFNSQFQELCHRARGFSSAGALTEWITAFTKHKKRITCNGAHQPIKRR